MSKLFEPIRVGTANLSNRIVLAPLTRFRNEDDGVPLPFVKDYYEQRASVPGTLLISEGTIVSKAAASVPNVPGIWSEAQVAGWRPITDAVHAKGSAIYCQLWHPGRAGIVDAGGPSRTTQLFSASAIPIDEKSPVPKEMTEEDITDTIRDFAKAATNAVRAGFDGVEIHGANGYLLDQFTQNTSNHRTDAWGGNIENRAKFVVELTKAVVEAIGADKTALRLSPFSPFQAMLMEKDLLYPQFEYLLKQLKPLGLAFLHLVEPRISGNADIDVDTGYDLGFFVKLWDNSSPIVLAGGFTAESAAKAADETYRGYDVLIAFGRYYISNPDLVFRIKSALEFAKYDRASFYIPKSPKGYIDYPFSPEFLANAA